MVWQFQNRIRDWLELDPSMGEVLVLSGFVFLCWGDGSTRKSLESLVSRQGLIVLEWPNVCVEIVCDSLQWGLLVHHCCGHCLRERERVGQGGIEEEMRNASNCSRL